MYANYPLRSLDDFSELCNSITALEGLNVTIPYKEQIIPLLDELDEASLEVGAVNTIRFERGHTIGYNTDVIGFEQSLRPLLDSSHTAALVLGTGGASKAIAFVLRRLGIACRFVSRTKQSDGCLRYEDLDEGIMRITPVIVNTTPVGTAPNTEEAPPIPYEFIGSGHLLYDLVYNPAETLFLRNGKAAGAQVKNGYEMLELQAEASWDIWNR